MTCLPVMERERAARARTNVLLSALFGKDLLSPTHVVFKVDVGAAAHKC